MTSQSDEIEPIAAVALGHLKCIVKESGLEAEVLATSEPNVDIALEIVGEEAGFFVGQHGHILDALQYLLSLIVNNQRASRLRIVIDADGYRAKRVQTLTKFANELADQVVASGEEAITDPMNPMERRIVHTVLAERADVSTYSEGEEPRRCVVVSPRSDG